MCDNRHLGPTHGAPCEYFENEMRDHVLIQRQGGAMTLYGGAMLYTTTWYTGPGVLLSKQVWGDATQFEMIANTPVSDGKIKSWHGCLVKSATGTITAEDKEMAKAIQAGALEAFSKDFEIWQNKTPALKPMAMKTEGPFLKVEGDTFTSLGPEKPPAARLPEIEARSVQHSTSTGWKRGKVQLPDRSLT